MIVQCSNQFDILPQVSDLTGEIIGGFLFLLIYEYFSKNIYNYLRLKYLIGTYDHIKPDGNFCFEKNGNRNHSILELHWFNPFELRVKSFDYGNDSIEWNGTYNIDLSRKYAVGFWKYANNIDVGSHILQFIDKNTIIVQLTTHTQGIDLYYIKRRNR